MTTKFEPIEAPPGGKIRFGVGTPDGLHGTTWSVFGSRTKRDVYFSARNDADIKVSLHQSGEWRLAFTSSYASMARMSNRLLHGIAGPPWLVDGWHRAVTVVVPPSALKLGPPEKKPRKGERVVWVPASGVGALTIFEVLIADPTYQGFRNDQSDEVGRMPLPGGGMALVAVYRSSAPEYRDSAVDATATLRSMSHNRRDLRGYAMGRATDDGHIMVYDVGDPSSLSP